MTFHEQNDNLHSQYQFDDAYMMVESVYSRMPEEVLFKTERRQSRADIAAYLRTVADKLDAGEEMTLSTGDESVSLSVPAEPEFEVKAERETSSGGGPAELSVEFEIEWDEGSDQGSSGSLEIE